ncbi:glycine cleavage system protein H [Myxococcus stipitatus DSM 14675]|uniref:Glycine cleavage system H protein n=1 Tax=Myxococcus stipitatus (strain DSM 14675 / JCM 12634 / Mx s8) TaxID=1278073 RepID=L7UAB7_MYXSD|nr:glycine cleavage system protein GcvH [Myxococcus stipitatus]AGC44815.1 glycine cleavage system protein H [Myxococcus stipitatus DSM 14675]
MSNIPENLKYTSDHEWARIEGNKAVVGITDHAQNTLGDVVYVELPKVGRKVAKGEAFGTVESVKAVSELFSPLSGTITKINEELTGEPELLNTDTYSDGWIIEIELSDTKELAELLDAAAYAKLLQNG